MLLVMPARVRDRVLSAIRPGHDAPPPARWQQQKSRRTRDRIVATAVDLLVTEGYPGLAVAAVAERCGLSRGAMHHHFRNRGELVAAVIEHVFYERMRNFVDMGLAAFPGRTPEEIVGIACDLHWQSVKTREYAAWLELAVAARTDAALAAIFVPAARRFDEVWLAEMRALLPLWGERWAEMQLASDLVMAAHTGLLVLAPALGGEERAARVLAHLADVVRALHGAPSDGAVPSSGA